MAIQVHRFSNDELLEILSLSENAAAVYSSEALHIQSANDAMIGFWGKDRSIIGMPLEEAVPELKLQPFVNLLKEVWRTGGTYKAKDTAAVLKVEGKMQVFYFDFVCRAVKDSAGKVYCILHTAVNVTEQYNNRQAIRDAGKKEQALNEELAAANEELAAINEELMAVNEELTGSYDSLKVLNNKMAESEQRFRGLVKQAPVAIAVYRGPEFVIELANEKMLAVWGRNEDVIGKPLIVARPEMAAHYYMNVLNEVYATRRLHHGSEVKGMVLRNGKPVENYYDVLYQPLQDNTGRLTGIIAVITDVTEKVEARKELERAYEQIRLSKEAAQLGTFDMDLLKSTMEWDARCRELFGISHSRQVNYETDFQQGLHKDDRERVLRIIDKAFIKAVSNGDYDVEYRTIGTEDGILRWVRAKGKVLFDESDKPVRFIGSVMDITQQVAARQELEKTEEMLRAAIDAAQMGTWYMDVETRRFLPSARLKELLGYYPDEDMTFDAAMSQVSEEYKEEIETAVEAVLTNGVPFDKEYTVIGYHDKKLRWVRATGKLYDAETNRQAHFSGTVLDITERKLEDQRKDDFITIASHELKTPVTSLKAALQLMNRIKDQPSPPMLPKLIEQSNKSIEKISSLIESLLNASRMNAGQLHLNKSTFTIAEVLGQCCNHVRSSGRHDIIIEGDEQLQIYADEHRIEQVVVNFVNNAAKYAPEIREIYLTIEKLAGMARVSVRDAGPGIAADKLPHLFERYYRADYDGVQYSGLGLGLYISAEIIKRHGGRIGVESAIGKGSTFWFMVPVV